MADRFYDLINTNFGGSSGTNMAEIIVNTRKLLTLGQTVLMAIGVLKVEIVRSQKLVTKSLYVSLSTDTISDGDSDTGM
jgi:hypothetical protein